MVSVWSSSYVRLSSLTTTSLVAVRLAVRLAVPLAVRLAVLPGAPVAVPAGRHRPVAAGILVNTVDTWWFITITWFTRLGLGVVTRGHPGAKGPRASVFFVSGA